MSKAIILIKLVAIIIFLTFFGLLLFSGCNASANGIDYKTLYREQVALNLILAGQNDSLRIKIDYLNQLVSKTDSIYQRFAYEAFQKIDSLKANIEFKDSVVVIMLYSIQDGLENISDQGLANLIELRKK